MHANNTNKFMENKEKLIIISILILAFILRVLGINYGLPNFFIGDEQALIGGSLKMIELKTLIPSLHPEEFRLLYYPPFVSYLYLLFFIPIILIKYIFINNFGLLKINLILNPGSFILMARFLSVLFSTATIYIIYLLSKKIFNKKTAIFSSLFLAFSFLHIQLSHMARHWVYDLFFCYLIILFSFYLDKKRNYFFIGLLAGLAFGTNYLSMISLIIPIIIHFFQSISFSKKIYPVKSPQSGELAKGELFNRVKDKSLWIMIFTFLAIAILFIFLNSPAFFRISVGEKSGLILSKSITSYLLSFPYYFKVLLKLETVLLITFLIGSAILFFKNKKIFSAIFLFIFFYISILYLFFHHEPRYILLILPMFCLLGGFGLSFITEKLNKKCLVLLAFVIFFYPFILGLKYDFLLLKKDNRVLAKEWVENNLNSKDKIASYWESIKLIPSKEAIEEQEKLDPRGLRSLENNLLSLDNRLYPSPSFYVLPLHFINATKISDLEVYLKENNYQYFLIDYWQKEELSERQKEVINKSELIKMFGENNPMDLNGNFSDSLFHIFYLKRLGPIVEIYKL